MTIDMIEEVFSTKKPVIAMSHLPALPGTPRYDEEAGIDALIEAVRYDIAHLADGGIDGIMFCNEDDRPYLLEAEIEQISAMTRVITECIPENLPFGVDFLWDPKAALSIAHATGAAFIREVLTGTYESDMGLWSPNAGEVLRYRRRIGAENIFIMFNVLPEFSSSLGERSFEMRAKSAVTSSLADAILISGPMAGEAPKLSVIEDVKKAIDSVPVFLNTGANKENIGEYLKVVDGVIVGSSLKEQGHTWNKVDPERVHKFMEAVNLTR